MLTVRSLARFASLAISKAALRALGAEYEVTYTLRLHVCSRERSPVGCASMGGTIAYTWFSV